jgi:hypothetical protein
MSARRRTSGVSWAALLLSAAALLSSPARAQTYEGEAVPPPPPEDDAQPPPPDAVPPAQPPDENTFEQNLSPYGRWIDTPEYGRVWVPYDTSPDWQPYTDGRWVDTQWGWSFASTVPWGWAVFHYGRWGFAPALGWFWVPGFVWAPAWVSWRYYPGYVCWSPFAPAGFVFGRHWPGWVAVPGIHFTHPIVRFRVPPAHVAPIVRAARPVAAIASAARAGFGATRNRSGIGSVRGGGSVRAGGNARATVPRAATRGFTRSAFRRGSGFRGSFSAAPLRSFGAQRASRGSFFTSSRAFAGQARSFVAPARAFARRR